jgi:hypothetical protein
MSRSNGVFFRIFLRRLEAGRSASPYLGSDLGNLSDDGKPALKGKGKSKAKQAGENKVG